MTLLIFFFPTCPEHVDHHADHLNLIWGKSTDIHCFLPAGQIQQVFLSGSGAERVHTLAEITEKLGEKMMHGYSFREISETLERYSYEIEDHETPQMIERQYFENRTDGITAFENIHFILADRRESA